MATRKSLGVWIAGAALAALLAACGGDTFLVKEVPYAAPKPPGDGETQIYVFREVSDFASGRKLAIIDNDTVVAVLTPGTFSHFTVPSGEHEIVGYFSPSPVMHYRVMPAPGKIVYLFCRVGYTTGMFMEVMDEAKARSLMLQFKYTEIEVKGAKANMDYKAYYDRLYK
jgi:hypothetical protein